MGEVLNMTSSSVLDVFTAQPAADLVVDTARQEYLNHQLYLTRIAIQRVVMVIVILFGVIGNTLNVAVLTRRWMKSSTNYYLTALAVYDTLYLILAFTLTWSHYDGIKSESWYIRYKDIYGRQLADTCSNTGVWLTLTFTIERYIGVCYPMKGKVWCTPRRAKYIILGVCLIAAVITFPEFFEFDIVEVVDSVRNVTTVRRVPTDFSKRPSYSIGYYYINQTIFTFLPLLLLLAFNSLLIRAVVHATKLRKTMTKTTVPADAGGNDLKESVRPCRRGGGGGGKSGGGGGVSTTSGGGGGDKSERHQCDQQRITIMLISVVIVFLVCQLPQAVQKLYAVYITTTGQLSPEERTILTITANYFNLLVTINCSTNFILYSFFSTKFRMTFRRIFNTNCRYGRSIVQRTFAHSDLLLSTADMSTVAGAAAMHMYVIDDGRTSYTNVIQVDDVTEGTVGVERNGRCTASTCVAAGVTSKCQQERRAKSRSPCFVGADYEEETARLTVRASKNRPKS